MGALDALLLVGVGFLALKVLDKQTQAQAVELSESVQKTITGGTTISDFFDPIGTGTQEQNPVFQAGKTTGDFVFEAGATQGKLFNFITGNIGAGANQIEIDFNNFLRDIGDGFQKILAPSKAGSF